MSSFSSFDHFSWITCFLSFFLRYTKRKEGKCPSKHIIDLIISCLQMNVL
ncbi:hypothetical protein CsatA_002480 [Cannabis sativa]